MSLWKRAKAFEKSIIARIVQEPGHDFFDLI